jgi:hypothetical protein
MCSLEHYMTLLAPLPASQPLPGGRPEKIVELRRLLNEKFPLSAPGAKHRSAHASAAAPPGALVRGALTEFVGSLGSGSLYFARLLRATAAAQSGVAVIDGGRSFCPDGWERGLLDRVLWILCDDARQAVKAADLLLRDGNLSLVILDLQTLAPRELAGIPASTWHRFHRLAEQTSVSLLVLSSRPLVEGVRVRIASRARWTLDAMRRRRRALWEELDLKVFERGEAARAALNEHLKTA